MTSSENRRMFNVKYMKLKESANVRFAGFFCRANLLFKRENLFYTLQMTAGNISYTRGEDGAGLSEKSNL